MSELLMCRTCVSTPPRHNLLPLFDRPELHRRYSLSLHIATGLQIKMNDGLPQHICVTCSRAVKNVLRFRKTCQMAHKVLLNTDFLREMAQSTVKSESEKSADDYDDEKAKITVKRERAARNNSKGSNSAADADMKFESDWDVSDDDLVSASNYVNVEIKLKYEDLDSLQIEENAEGSLRSDKFGDNTACTIQQEATSSATANVCEDSKKQSKRPLSLAERAAHLAKRKSNVEKKLKLMRQYLDVTAPLYTCKLCKKRYPYRNTLLQHTQVHTGLEFMCEQCSKAFRHSSALLVHQRAVHGAAPDSRLKCPHCEFYGRDRSRLKIHVRKHTGERPYVCDTCGASFRSQGMLSQHATTHITEKNVQCDQCPSKFASRYQLKVHRNKSHKPRRWSYQCPYCPNIYSKIGSCRKHMTNSHGLPIDQQEKPVRVPSGISWESKDQGGIAH